MTAIKAILILLLRIQASTKSSISKKKIGSKANGETKIAEITLNKQNRVKSVGRK